MASHGLQSTAELVRTRISTEMPSGYSCAGVVVGGGRGRRPTSTSATAWPARAPATRTTPAVNVVPRNLVARVPDGVSFEEAAFGTLGAIALQGVRRAEPGLGDRVAVLGLGLLGQITVQMLQGGRRRRDRRRRAAGPRARGRRRSASTPASRSASATSSPASSSARAGAAPTR